MSENERQGLKGARRVVVKVGTRVLTHPEGGISLSRLAGIVEEIVRLKTAGAEVILVSSGAVGLGRRQLGYTTTPNALGLRQAFAAVGQSRLMSLYQDAFAVSSVICAQVLLTEEDFHERTRCLNLRRTLATLLEHGVVPVINENDVVSVQELAVHESHGKPVFGDNDRLSALVASEIGCDLLVILTDVAGLFDRDPRNDPSAKRISRVDDLDSVAASIGGSVSGVGRGGMRTKVDAAVVAARSGCHAVIASGLTPGALARVLAGEDEGTWFPRSQALSARHRWIAFATRSSGALHLDAGAVKALTERGASLLAAGITGVDGAFEAGAVVELRGPDKALVGRGVSEVDSEWIGRWLGGERGADRKHLVVHRNDMVVEP
ncbi:MAG TPA: glutamate 5-kinase [Myxococcota bacterium]|nr:glutamate 5-kinase [Myxococcota bacterium]